jgi:hypothetical protein
MNRRTASTLATAVALCAPACALAAGNPQAHAASESCGATNSLYCIPAQSTFAFAHLKKVPKHCSIEVGFAVEPEVKGASGHASLQLLGVSRHDKSIDRSAHPAVGTGPVKYEFTQLRTGSYKLVGWYEGDSARSASTHVTKRFALHCG